MIGGMAGASGGFGCTEMKNDLQPLFERGCKSILFYLVKAVMLTERGFMLFVRAVIVFSCLQTIEGNEICPMQIKPGCQKQ